MAEYCRAHAEAKIQGALHLDVYGFRVTTEKFRYYFRCFPHGGTTIFTCIPI